jgi:hypothetical protein
LLVSTIVVAGIFAFAPIQDASTFHATLFATNLVRVDKVLSETTGLSGWVTFDRVVGDGAFQIEKLFICDLESNGNSPIHVFEFQTETSQTTGTHAKMLNRMGHMQQTYFSGSGSVDEEHEDGGCRNILLKAIFDQGHTTSNTGQNAAYLNLAGDGENDVIVFMRKESGGITGTPDGATMVAYITGLQSGTDIQLKCFNGACTP